jgi:hypothetical protein
MRPEYLWREIIDRVVPHMTNDNNVDEVDETV